MDTPFDLRTARGRRAFMIDRARRRQRPGTGSDLRRLMERGPLMPWPDLHAILGPLPWAVIGAVATRLYMPERVTRDLDILVDARDAAEVERRLAAARWVRGGDLAIGGSSWTSPDGAALDVVAFEAPWLHDALQEATGNRDGKGLPVLPLPYLVLLKLISARMQDTADVTRMLGLADEAALDRVREVVQQHSPEDAEDLEALIELGSLEAQ